MELLATLTPVLPLLQSVPLYIDTAKTDIKDTFREVQSAYASQALETRPSRRKYRESTPDTLPPSPRSKTRRKRQKPNDHQRHYGRGNSSNEDLSCSTTNLSPHLGLGDSQKLLSSPIMYSNSGQTSSSASYVSLHHGLTVPSRPQPSNISKISISNATTPVDPRDASLLGNPTLDSATVKTIPDPCAKIVQNVDLCLSSRSIAQDSETEIVHSTTPADPIHGPVVPRSDPTPEFLETKNATTAKDDPRIPGATATRLSPGGEKPMSLKDRRARGLVTDPFTVRFSLHLIDTAQHYTQGKRYISFDDEDDE